LKALLAPNPVISQQAVVVPDLNVFVVFIISSSIKQRIEKGQAGIYIKEQLNNLLILDGS